MIPSPMPMSTWTPIIAPATEPTLTASLPPSGVLDRERHRRQHRRRRRGEPGGERDAARGPPEEAPEGEEDRVPAERPDERHVHDVEAERRQPAVGEQQRLDDEHHRHGQGARGRPDEDGRQHGAEEVAARAVGDGEVEHLGGEHEGGDEPDDGHLALVERP